MYVKKETKGLPRFTSIDQLIPGGVSRPPEFMGLMKFSRETFNMFEKQGKTPKPIKLSTRLVFYKNDEIRDFILNPQKWILGMDENGNAPESK